MFALSAPLYMHMNTYRGAGRCVWGVFMRARPGADQTSHIGRGCPPVAVPTRRTTRTIGLRTRSWMITFTQQHALTVHYSTFLRSACTSSVTDPFVGSLALLYSNHADLLTARSRRLRAKHAAKVAYSTVHAHAATPSENESTSRSLLPLVTTWPGQPHPQAAPEAPACADAARL